MIDRDMTAPFMAVVMTGRSAKADKGEAVEVHCYSGKWDSARCKRSDGEFVWLSFKLSISELTGLYGSGCSCPSLRLKTAARHVGSCPLKLKRY